MKDCMVDLETLGRPPDGVIVSIGAVQFDPWSRGSIGSRFYQTVDPVESVKRWGRTLDPGMVVWWMGQPEEVRRAAFPEPPLVGDALPLIAALARFADWFTGLKLQRIWAWPPTFDIALLVDSFEAVGVKRPWPRRGEMDARTAVTMGLTPNARRPELPVEAGSGLPRHHALADAWAQARLVQETLDRKAEPYVTHPDIHTPGDF